MYLCVLAVGEPKVPDGDGEKMGATFTLTDSGGSNGSFWGACSVGFVVLFVCFMLLYKNLIDLPFFLKTFKVQDLFGRYRANTESDKHLLLSCD